MRWLRRPNFPAIPTGLLGGCVAGASAFWIWTTHEWPFSLWTTLQASVNAEKYGHPVEHFAQGLVVGMMFFGVVGSAAGGYLGRTLQRRRLL